LPVALAVCVVSLLGSLLAVPSLTAAPASSDDPAVTVSETDGVFMVAARFHVPQAPSAVLAILTDYEGIPRVMPDVTRSVVKSRSADRVLVEQQAVSRVMFFSKTVHLMLDVHETDGAVIFRDVCGRSFMLYEGAWRVTPAAGATLVTYELRARPAFDVPDFLVKRLFKRDAGQLIARLRQAIGN
jgi:ribosome-associated toxin RatA of RatAB toxin-antitoxin module